MADLVSNFSTTGLRSLLDTPERAATMADIAAAREAETQTSFGQGLRRSMLTTPALLADAGGQILEPFAPESAQPMFDWAEANRQQAAAIPMPVEVTNVDPMPVTETKPKPKPKRTR